MKRYGVVRPVDHLGGPPARWPEPDRAWTAIATSSAQDLWIEHAAFMDPRPCGSLARDPRPETRDPRAAVLGPWNANVLDSMPTFAQPYGVQLPETVMKITTTGLSCWRSSASRRALDPPADRESDRIDVLHRPATDQGHRGAESRAAAPWPWSSSPPSPPRSGGGPSMRPTSSHSSDRPGLAAQAERRRPSPVCGAAQPRGWETSFSPTSMAGCANRPRCHRRLFDDIECHH